MDHFCLVFVMLLCASIYSCLLSPSGRGLTSWLSFVMSNCEAVTFPFVFWDRCVTRLYRFLIIARFLTLHVNCCVAVLIFCCQIHDLVVYPNESRSCMEFKS